MFGEMAQSHIFLLRFTQCGVCPIGLWLLACLGRKKTSEPFIVLAGVFLSAVLMCRHGLFLGRRETFLGSSAGLLHTRWAMPAVSHSTQITTKSVQVKSAFC